MVGRFIACEFHWGTRTKRGISPCCKHIFWASKWGIRLLVLNTNYSFLTIYIHANFKNMSRFDQDIFCFCKVSAEPCCWSVLCEHLLSCLYVLLVTWINHICPQLNLPCSVYVCDPGPQNQSRVNKNNTWVLYTIWKLNKSAFHWCVVC